MVQAAPAPAQCAAFDEWNCPFCAVSVQWVQKGAAQDWLCRGFCRDETECRRIQAEKKSGPGKQSGGAVNGGMDHDGMDAQLCSIEGMPLASQLTLRSTRVLHVLLLVCLQHEHKRPR